MKIDHEFTVPAPADEVWSALTDIPGIVPCLPGAQLTGVTSGPAEAGGDSYDGTLRVRVAGVTAEYEGVTRFVSRDDAAHQAVIEAIGVDSRGGQAAAVITMTLGPAGARTRVLVDTDLEISGRIAQLGAGMIQEASDRMLERFVDALAELMTVPDPAEAEFEPAELEPVLETVPEPVPETVPGPVLGTVPEPVLGTVPEPVPKTVRETVPKTVRETAPGTGPGTEPEFTSVPAKSVAEGSLVRGPVLGGGPRAGRAAAGGDAGPAVGPWPPEDSVVRRLVPAALGLVAAAVAVLVVRARRRR